MQKMRTFVSKYTHTSRGGTGVLFLCNNNMSLQVMLAPTQLVWFRLFITRGHKRMGDIWISDTAVSRYIIRTSMDVLEESWHELGKDFNHQLRVETAACIIISGYFGNLQGEEISKAKVEAICHHWNKSMFFLLPQNVVTTKHNFTKIELLFKEVTILVHCACFIISSNGNNHLPASLDLFNPCPLLPKIQNLLPSSIQNLYFHFSLKEFSFPLLT